MQQKKHIISFINIPQYDRLHPIMQKIIMRDVNLIVGIIDDVDYIYFDFKDEITTSKTIINFVTYMEQNHEAPGINKTFRGDKYKDAINT